jgi:hypothetical protein
MSKRLKYLPPKIRKWKNWNKDGSQVSATQPRDAGECSGDDVEPLKQNYPFIYSFI